MKSDSKYNFMLRGAGLDGDDVNYTFENPVFSPQRFTSICQSFGTHPEAGQPSQPSSNSKQISYSTPAAGVQTTSKKIKLAIFLQSLFSL